MVRSLVTFVGIRKNIVWQACCGHLPPEKTAHLFWNVYTISKFVISWCPEWRTTYPSCIVSECFNGTVVV